MARSHLTLAALATAAVPGLDVVTTSSFGTGTVGDYDAALLTDRAGHHWIARLPRSQRAEAEQNADIVALQALSAGVRTRLPFVVSTYAGRTPINGTHAVVYEFVYGTKIPLAKLDADTATSIGRAIAAIHALPTSFVADAGLPVLTPQECLRAAITIIDRAAGTGRVPGALLERWEGATEEAGLWQFQPTVINGGLSADSFLMANGDVTGVLGWQELRVGDPAKDLFWLLGSRGELVAESGFDAYNHERGGDRQVRQRAMLYAELEIAKWLLHGTDTRSSDIVDDAVDMMHGLIDSFEDDATPINAQTPPTMAVDEVQAMLNMSDNDRNESSR